MLSKTLVGFIAGAAMLVAFFIGAVVGGISGLSFDLGNAGAGGLDPVMQEVFIDFIRNEKKCGKTILLSSHIFSEVEALCDRIAIIKDGRLISTVAAADVKHGLKNEFTIEFESTDDYNRFVHSGLTPERGDRTAKKCVISVPDELTNSFLTALSKCSITGIDEHSVSLEEYFMHFYKNNIETGGNV